MKTALVPLAAILLIPSIGLSQDMVDVYTRPTIPSRAALNRLNLKEGWRTYVGMDGTRDHIFGVQILGDQILVQNRSGVITLIDAEDGSILWRAQPGKTYMVGEDVAHNRRSVFAVRGGELYALDRKTGKLQWEMTLPHGVSATPFADNERLYLCLLTKELYAYDLPETVLANLKAPTNFNAANPEAMALEKAELGSQTDAAHAQGSNTLPPPMHVWTYSAETRLEKAPLSSGKLLALSGVDGIYFACAKINGRPLYRFRAEAPVTAPLGQYNDTAFMASQDTNLYAVDIVGGRLKWRFTAGGPILLKPEIEDDGVYVSPFAGGLFRIDRETGTRIWRNPTAGRFVAANKKFVYAMDRTGRLLVLDKAHGNVLSALDVRGFVFPVSNERTDRIILAANNGLILCLHDRDYPQLVKMKTSADVLRDYASAAAEEVAPAPEKGKAPSVGETAPAPQKGKAPAAGASKKAAPAPKTKPKKDEDDDDQ